VLHIHHPWPLLGSSLNWLACLACCRGLFLLVASLILRGRVVLASFIRNPLIDHGPPFSSR